jgi:protein-disulfide isomerase
MREEVAARGCRGASAPEPPFSFGQSRVASRPEVSMKRPLIMLLLLAFVAAPALADKASDARIKALEEKVQMLERRIQALEARPAAPARPKRPDEDTQYSLPVGDSPVLGPKDAPVKITVFSDLQCPFCARVHPLFLDVLKDRELKGKVALVWKHFPLSFHKDARPAAYAAMAAREQSEEAFWTMVEGCFAQQRGLTTEYFDQIASRAGLDLRAFHRAYQNNQTRYDELIEQDMALGQRSRVRGTPSIFVGGYPLKTRSVDAVKDIIRTRGLAKL